MTESQNTSPQSIEYATVTWDQLHCDARNLAELLMSKHAPFKGIVAITRGGLIPAAILARELGCRVVESISIASYSGEEGTQGEIKVLKSAPAAGDGEGFLIVDDLVDSGVTARYVREMMPKAVFACLYAKPDGKPLTDYFITEVPQETWVLFPWDTKPLFVPPLCKSDI